MPETDPEENPNKLAAVITPASEAQRAVRVVDAPLAPPSANQGVLEVFRRRYLLRILVRREIQARYQSSFLGFLWSYINPLSQFFIYWFVMGYILMLHASVENFAIHIFSAIIITHFFTESFGAGTRSIVSNKALVQKMAMPREMFPVAAMLVSLWHVVPQMVILLIVAPFYGWVPSFTGAFAVVLAILLMMLFGTALALLFSVANVYFRDFGSAVSIMLHFVRFGVPMIYPFSMIVVQFPGLVDYYLLNPIANAVLLFQDAFWIPTLSACAPGELPVPEGADIHAKAGCTMLDIAQPDHLIERGLIMLAAGVLFLAFAQWVFTKLEAKIPERL